MRRNIVGYQTKTVAAGFSLSTPTFVDVGAVGTDIQNFKLGAEAAGDGTEVIQVLDENGVNNVTWTWLNDNVGMTAGWYDADSWEIVAHSISAGEGFLMSVDTDVSMTMAGQVGEETVITIPAGFSIIGNNTPVSVDIQAMTLGSNAAGDGTEVIQVLNENGVNNVTWTWLNENVGMPAGWYDAGSWELIEEDVPAGTAFLFSVDAETTITIPGAL